jgi:hypothetical protein
MLTTAVRLLRNIFNAYAPCKVHTCTTGAYPHNQASLGVVQIEELESRMLLSASPVIPNINTNDPPIVVQAGLLATDPEDSLIAGDLDSDGFVGISDLNIVLGNWNLNVPPGNPAADISGDGFVGIEDLNVILGNWNNNAVVGLSSGLSLSGTIINNTDTDYFSIQAQAGDDLLLTIGDVSFCWFVLDVSM